MRTCYLWVWVVLAVAGCDFGDTNLDPTRSTDAELREVLPGAQAQTARNLASIGGRVTGTVIQHFKGVDAQPEGYSQYLIDERTLDVFWRSGLYAGAMKDCHFLREQALEQGRPHYRALANILLAVNLGLATSYWGDVPFRQAFQGLDNPQPAYDTQEDIYLSIQELLAEALDLLAEAPSESPPAEDDLIFQGNAAAWAATARALQARYHLHLSRRRPDAALQALHALQSGAFQSAELQPDFPFAANAAEANPLPLYNFERPDQLVLGDFLLQKLQELNDPRLRRYAVFRDDLPLLFELENPDLYWGRFEAPLPLISLAEVRFLEAEARLRLGETEAAYTALRQAVSAHFEQLGFPPDSARTYLDERLPALPTPPDEALEVLITQKYIALFGQNPSEAWVDYRRTGFPRLQPPPDAHTSFNPSKVIPRRYLYPISERTSNPVQMEIAIQRQGGHLLDRALWAFE